MRFIPSFINRKIVSCEKASVAIWTPTPTPQARLEASELRQRVLDAIGRLSKTQRETVTLYYISEYSQAEVASILGVPVGTIKRRLHDARERLKEGLLDMVEEVLKDSGPDSALAARSRGRTAGPAGAMSENRIL